MAASHIHFEAFVAMADENFKPEPFDIKLASTGETLRVPADRSALEVLREHGLALPSSCELGLCGSCACGYRDGIVIHRDSVLDANARRDRILPCVSRARVKVTLDLKRAAVRQERRYRDLLAARIAAAGVGRSPRSTEPTSALTIRVRGRIVRWLVRTAATW